MSDYTLKETQTLEYKRPDVVKGYADQTLYINLSDPQIEIKPVAEETKKTFTGGKGMICGCCGMRFRPPPAGMILKMPCVLRPAR